MASSSVSRDATLAPAVAVSVTVTASGIPNHDAASSTNGWELVDGNPSNGSLTILSRWERFYRFVRKHKFQQRIWAALGCHLRAIKERGLARSPPSMRDAQR